MPPAACKEEEEPLELNEPAVDKVKPTKKEA
jgi:hypothetical protein